MRRPLRRGTPIDMARMTSWVSLFAGYRISVTEQRIDRWLDQFADSDRDAAARVLDCVDYFTHEQMASAFRSVLRGMDRWNMRQRERRGQWRFVAFSASAGESGDTMLHKFRLANGLGSRKHNQLFICWGKGWARVILLCSWMTLLAREHRRATHGKTPSKSCCPGDRVSFLSWSPQVPLRGGGSWRTRK